VKPRFVVDMKGVSGIRKWLIPKLESWELPNDGGTTKIHTSGRKEMEARRRRGRDISDQISGIRRQGKRRLKS